MYELLIVGGGPAGMTAAVYAGRQKLKVLLISKDLGGQPNLTAGIENYLGFQYIEGPELMEKFEAHLKQFPLDMKIGETATRVIPRDGAFEVKTDKGESYQAKAVIIATGKRSRPLNVPGEQRLVGRGVSYCVICDGPLFEGEKVAVIGGGNSALEAVNDLAKIAQHIYLVSITPLTADAILVDRVKDYPNLTVFTQWRVLEIEGDNRVRSIKIKSLTSPEEKELPVGGVFVEIGLIPNSALVKNVVALNQQEEIIANCACETNIPGLFAAGDVTTVPEKQIVVAAGEGSKAALQAHRYLQRLRLP